MAKSLCLSLGEFFAEVSLKEAGKKEIRSTRWPTSKSSLEKGLQSFLASHLSPDELSEITEIQVNLPVLESLLRRRLGNPPAFFTTEGFENWLEMNLPVEPQHFCLKPKRVRSPLDSDMVFGISERIDTEGKVVRPLEISEIDFLISKLKMNEVKWVAVGLLHADKNPEHENKMADILIEQGFEVIKSSNFKSDAERPRWWAAILTAYLAPLAIERVADVKKVFETLGLTAPVQFWTGSGLKSEWRVEDTLELLFGSSQIVKTWCAKNSIPGTLFVDLEGFYLQNNTTPQETSKSRRWNSELGPVAFEGCYWKKLPIQPTSTLTDSWLGGLDFSQTEVGFEPGPISMGRGLVPCFIDSLNLIDSEDKILGFSEHLQAKSKTRISEAVSTLARNFTSKDEWADVKELTEDLCDLGLRQILREFIHPLGAEVFITGGMASIISKKLQKVSGLPVKIKANPSMLGELALGGRA